MFPANLPPGAPLVIVLHGSAMDGAMMRRWTGYEFDQLADRKGFVALYPDGYKRNWNDCRRNTTFPAKTLNIDDMGFIRALIARFEARDGIDPAKVYALGYSNGGHMAFRLAMEEPILVAAVAAVGANLPTPDASSCPQQGRSARVMLVNGTDDPINPFGGGKVALFGFTSRGAAMSSRATAEEFARRNGVTTPPIATQLPHRDPADPTSVDRLMWPKDDKPFVALYTVHGGGHVVPQSRFRFPRLLGRTNADLDTPAEAMEFFDQSR